MNAMIKPMIGLDEIVFANRNKAYGAYELRKSYPSHMVRSLLLTILVFILLYIFVNVAMHQPTKIDDSSTGILTPFQPMNDYVMEIQLKPSPQIPSVSLKKRVLPDVYRIENDDRVNTLPIQTTPEINHGSSQTVGVEHPASSGLGIVGEIPVVQPPDPVVYVDEMPEFPGGEKAMHEYLKSHIEIPREAELAQITGKVLLSFVVEPDGSITSVNVEKSRGFGLDEEAVKVIQQMPKWKPGIQNNKKVRVKFFLPIQFEF